jgi:hypothetical protein
MHSILPWKMWLSIVFSVFGAIVLINVWFGAQPFEAARTAGAWTTLLATIFVTIGWKVLWLLPSIAAKIPAIDGEWTGVMRSNWSIVDALKTAAKQNGAPAVDVDDPNNERPALVEVPVHVTACTTFLGVSLVLETGDGGYQISRLKAAEVKPAADGAPATLAYVFEGRVQHPRPGDSSCFEGAGILSIRKGSDGVLTMQGPGWTNRNWERGLNTAGLLHLNQSKGTFWPLRPKHQKR